MKQPTKPTAAELVQRLKSLPLLPGGIAKILALDPYDPDFLDAACSIIKGDQALTAQLLRLANSVQFGGQASVTNVERAFMRVGSKMIAGTLAEGQILRVFNTRDPTVVRLWFMSTFAGSMSQALAERRSIEGVAPETAFTYGFLYDIGFLVYLTLFPDGSALVADYLWGGDAPSEERERRVFGTTHAEIGEAAARHWGFPPNLQLVIGNHHFESSNRPGMSDVSMIRALNLLGIVDAIVPLWVAGQMGAPFGRTDIEGVFSNSLRRRACDSLGIGIVDAVAAIRSATAASEAKRALLGLPQFPQKINP
jgi:HD-like signal output (HDOD) protein